MSSLCLTVNTRKMNETCRRYRLPLRYCSFQKLVLRNATVMKRTHTIESSIKFSDASE